MARFMGGSRGRGSYGRNRGSFGRGRGRGRGGFRGGRRRREPSGIVLDMGTFMHSAGEKLVFKAKISDVPMFNQSVLNSQKNGQEIGRIDDILGPVDSYYFSVIPNEGVKKESFQKGQSIFIDKAFLMPLRYFTHPTKKITKGGSRGGRGGFRGRGRGRGGTFNRRGRGSYGGGSRSYGRGENRNYSRGGQRSY